MRRQARPSSISLSIDWMEDAKLWLLPHAQPLQAPFLWQPLCFHSLHPCGLSLANCQMAADRCPVSLLQLLPSFTVKVPLLTQAGALMRGKGWSPGFEGSGLWCGDWAVCQVFSVLLKMGQCQGLTLPAGKWTQGHWSPG